jgi:large subunit ribosomal protein L24
MKIKVNDKVIVITGSEKGKIGKVNAILKRKMRVIVEGVNVGIKHVKSKKTKSQEKTTKGSLKQMEFPLHYSNVQIYSEMTKKGSRIGISLDDNKKVRFLKKTKEIIE